MVKLLKNRFSGSFSEVFQLRFKFPINSKLIETNLKFKKKSKAKNSCAYSYFFFFLDKFERPGILLPVPPKQREQLTINRFGQKKSRLPLEDQFLEPIQLQKKR